MFIVTVLVSLNILLQNESAVEYIHHKRDSEEHLNPEMGK